jgi:hypothetical protein
MAGVVYPQGGGVVRDVTESPRQSMPAFLRLGFSAEKGISDNNSREKKARWDGRPSGLLSPEGARKPRPAGRMLSGFR